MIHLDVIACGYPSLDHILRSSRAALPGETGILLDPPRLDAATLGGCATNVAVACRRLGLSSGLAAVVGDDPAGRFFLKALQSEKVDTSLLRVRKGVYTSSTILLVDPQGRHQTFFYPGAADSQEEPVLVDADFTADWGVITVGNAHHNRMALEEFRARRIPVLWSMKNDPYSYPKDLVSDLSRYSTVIVMNEAEADAIKCILHYKDMADFLDDRTRLVITTCGKNGSRVLSTAGEEWIDSVPPERLVDPTGAGDAYTAGVLLGLARLLEFKICARLGSVVSSFVLEQVGCQTGLPDPAQVKKRYRSQFQEEINI